MTVLFEQSEYEARLAAVRRDMVVRGVGLCLISTPENIYYLTGLDHWGYFAAHVLIVPAEGEMTLIARAMEKVTITHQVTNAVFEGHTDSETAADLAVRVLRDRRYAEGRTVRAADAAVEAIADTDADTRRIGIEFWSSGLSHGMAESLKAAWPSTEWVDVTGLVDQLRTLKSSAERDFMRTAAKVSDAAAAAAIETVREGASERDVAAECQRAMIAAGGTYPGFGPFIRSTARLGEEHTTWSDQRFAPGDSVFLELSGCVARYHAPLGRLVHVGRAPEGTQRMAELCHEAFDAVLGAMRPGTLSRDVYAAWQAVVDRAGLAEYRRHHCGYLVGIGFPPSWTGGNRVTGLRHDSDLVMQTGMTFHVLSWLMGTGRGDFFISDTVLIGEDGPEVMTRTPSGITLR
jgi:Xaa-Pro dipeptidase